MSTRLRPWVLIGFAGIVLIWAYGTTLFDIVEKWNNDPQYSHGWLVPAFSAYLLYRRREMISSKGFDPNWLGLVFLLIAGVCRAAAIALYQPWLEAASLLISVASFFFTFGGKPALRWSWPSVLFLTFMVPLPYRLQTAMGSKLQTIATLFSTYCLQTLGVPAISEGNVILLSETRLGVVEACSGLSMLVTFFALATGFAILIERHWLYRLAMISAAIPIAVIANVIRISVTGILFEANRNDMARVVFHDVAGWLMMPLGVGLLSMLLVFLDRSFKTVSTPV